MPKRSKNQELIDYLSKYKILEKSINCVDYLIRDLENQKREYLIMASFSTGSEAEEAKKSYISKMNRDILKLSQEKKEYASVRNDIKAMIEGIEKEVHRKILFLRYIEGLDWLAISFKMLFNEDYLRGKLHTTAITGLQKEINKRLLLPVHDLEEKNNGQNLPTEPQFHVYAS